ncbi:GntR family transcriptional regulator [Alteribacillus sp. YIM 98480]|uniref:GntR family transcriptional regulator n=1 Tax=Alteribacillus sp. YIM 98480 TaxID=2606599 RepID=UPI00131C700B|nr:GntR family transcriptional regulator [Alteribacillus sp. YIM 98480]
MTVTKNIYTTKSDYVHQFLKRKILDGELSMGEDINISKVSKELNVSIIPVREGLKRLETEGLVEVIPHKGARVKTFNSEKIREIFDIRAVLEGLAAKTAISNMDADKIKQLKSMTDKMKAYAIEGNDKEFGQANKDFHRYIYKNSVYPRLYDMIFNLWEGSWTQAVFAFSPERMLASVEEHYEIIKAMEEKDEEKTEHLVKLHKLNTAELFVEVSKKEEG